MQETLAPSMQGTGVLPFVVYGLAALLLGAALHYLVERPFLRLRDRQAFAPSAAPQA